jgi:hypothetical protein
MSRLQDRTVFQSEDEASGQHMLSQNVRLSFPLGAYLTYGPSKV